MLKIFGLFLVIISCNKISLEERSEWLSNEDLSGEEILQFCRNAKQFDMMEERVFFPESGGCDWGGMIDGVSNLDERDGFVRARRKETISVIVPSEYVTCGVSIRSKMGKRIKYDDVLFFTMNKYILATGSGSFIPLFDKENNIPVWDFGKIKNKSARQYPWEGPSFCAGDNTTCKIPRTDTTNQFDLNYDDTVMSHIVSMIEDYNHLEFSLIITGDNIDGGVNEGAFSECFHTDIDFTVTVKYAPRMGPR